MTIFEHLIDLKSKKEIALNEFTNFAQQPEFKDMCEIIRSAFAYPELYKDEVSIARHCLLQKEVADVLTPTVILWLFNSAQGRSHKLRSDLPTVHEVLTLGFLDNEDLIGMMWHYSSNYDECIMQEKILSQYNRNTTRLIQAIKEAASLYENNCAIQMNKDDDSWEPAPITVPPNCLDDEERLSSDHSDFSDPDDIDPSDIPPPARTNETIVLSSRLSQPDSRIFSSIPNPKKDTSIIIDVPEDGNCFFHAVAYALKKQAITDISHETLRSQAIDYLKENSAAMQNYFPRGESPEKYLQQMTTLGTYAEGVIIEAVAVIMNVQLNIINNAINSVGEQKSPPIRINEGSNRRGVITLIRHDAIFPGDSHAYQHYQVVEMKRPVKPIIPKPPTNTFLRAPRPLPTEVLPDNPNPFTL